MSKTVAPKFEKYEAGILTQAKSYDQPSGPLVFRAGSLFFVEEDKGSILEIKFPGHKTSFTVRKRDVKKIGGRYEVWSIHKNVDSIFVTDYETLVEARAIIEDMSRDKSISHQLLIDREDEAVEPVIGDIAFFWGVLEKYIDEWRIEEEIKEEVKRYRLGNQPEEYELRDDYLGWASKGESWDNLCFQSAKNTALTIVNPEGGEKQILFLHRIVMKSAFPMEFFREENWKDWGYFAIVSDNETSEKFIIPISLT